MALKGEALIAGIAVGVGIGALAFAVANVEATNRRNTFSGRLRERLSEGRIGLVGADLGRDGATQIWVVTIVRPDGAVQTLHAAVVAGQDAFAMATADDVARRIGEYLVRQAA